MAKVKGTKKEAITFRVHENLKERFQQALELEGLTQTQFFVAKMQELCEKVERKRPAEDLGIDPDEGVGFEDLSGLFNRRDCIRRSDAEWEVMIEEVKSGQSINSVAKKHGVSGQQLRNRMKKNNR